MPVERRILRVAALFVAIAVACPGVRATAEDGRDQAPADVLAEARSALARDDGRRAADLLERALPDADATRRRAILDLLDRAYEAAAAQAERAGQARAAEDYRTHREILRHRSHAPAAPDADAATPAPVFPPDQAAIPPTPPAVAERVDAPQPPAAGATPARAASREPTAGADPPQDRPTPRALPETSHAPTPASDDAQVSRVSGPVVHAEPFPEPAEAGPSLDAPATPPAAREAGASLARADAAFRARRYDEAGVTYAALGRAGNLPPDHRDAWAYCRRYAVVRRIQSQPRSQAEWDAIRREIAAIRELSPRHWYDEYLFNRVNELAASGRPAR